VRSLRILAALLFIATGARPTLADDTPSPEALQAATELVSVVSADTMNQLTTQMFAAFWPPIEQKVSAANIDAATIAELRQELERIVSADVTDTMKETPSIYARHFTVAELRDIIAFYRTPTGANALHEMPKVMGEFSAEVLVPRLQKSQMQVADAINEILRRHGYVK
jgi:uncharacterized protein